MLLYGPSLVLLLWGPPSAAIGVSILAAGIIYGIPKLQQATKPDVTYDEDTENIIDGPPMHVTLYGGPLDGREILVGKDTIGYGDDRTGSLYYFCPEATARLGRYAFAHQPHPLSALS